jgi:hypothetical protein
MALFFTYLRALEAEKWKMLGDEKMGEAYSLIGVDRKEIEATIDTKVNYTYPTFYSIEGKGESFLPACWDFLTFNLLFVLLTYFLLRVAFRLLFNYRISIFLRAYSFPIYLSPFMLDGNFQYFCFLMFSQGYLGFSLGPRDKAFNCAGAILCFLVLWVTVLSSYAAYSCSPKLSKYVLDNWSSNVKGVLSYSLTNAIRLIVQAAIHSLLRFNYVWQLSALMTSELVYLVFLLFTMKTWKTYKLEFKVWFSFFFTFLRLFLQATLFLQQWGLTEATSATSSLFEDLLGTIINLYVLTFYTGTVVEVIYEMIEICKKCGSKDNLKKNKKAIEYVSFVRVKS